MLRMLRSPRWHAGVSFLGVDAKQGYVIRTCLLLSSARSVYGRLKCRKIRWPVLKAPFLYWSVD